MKQGLLERILILRYGQPTEGIRRGLHAHCWNPDEFDFSTVLYMGMQWKGMNGLRFESLKEIYGDAFGGFLIKNTLKVANLLPRKVYGIWNIDDLRTLPTVQHALVIDSGVDYFMDQYNVYYYGIKRGELYEFDSATDELNSLGPVESAVHTLLDDIEDALKDV
jgi:hypothetical protein